MILLGSHGSKEVVLTTSLKLQEEAPVLSQLTGVRDLRLPSA